RCINWYVKHFPASQGSALAVLCVFARKVLSRTQDSRKDAKARQDASSYARFCINANLAFKKQRSPATRAARDTNPARHSQQRPEARTEAPKHSRACTPLRHSLEHRERRLSGSRTPRLGRVSKGQRRLRDRAQR